MTDKNNKLPTYPVEYIEAEVIEINTLPQPRTTRLQQSRFQQFIDNVALAIVTGSITEETVYQRTTPAVFDAVQVSLARFDEMDNMYKSRSTLEGDVNEYLDPQNFTFRKNPNGFTQ